jgi:membrane dipeptidase
MGRLYRVTGYVNCGIRHRNNMSPRLLPCACLLALTLSAAAADAPAQQKYRGVAGIIDAAPASAWRTPDPANLLYLELPQGRVIIELAPRFAPGHTANIRTLAHEHFWDGTSIYRVQDNFVVQFGDADADDPHKAKSLGSARPHLPAEFHRGAAGLRFDALPDRDGWARQTGFVDGFPAARDPGTGRTWLAHCYGTVGAGRDNAEDSSTGAELYVVIGQSPRQLDDNLTVVGKVLVGMQLLSSLPRGPAPLGRYAHPAERTPIRAIHLASEVPQNERTDLRVLRTDSQAFRDATEARRNRVDEFYKRPAGHIDLCNVPVPVRVLPAATAQVVAPEVRALHERLLVLDSHLDTPAEFDDPTWDIMRRHAPGDGTSQVDYPRMVEGGLDGGMWAVYTPQAGRTAADDRAARDHGLKRLLEIHQLLAAHPDKFELALTPEDAPRIAAQGKRVVYISMENASPLTLDPTLLHFYYDQGLRVLGLVHFKNNDFADSATDQPEWHGLSPAGRQLVADANRMGLLIDQSHASDDVFDQLLELSKAPIVLTHSSSRAVHDHPRNLDDARIRRLAASGGVIQVNSYASYVADLGATPEYDAEYGALSERFGKLPPGAQRDADRAAAVAALDAKYHIRKATFDDYMTHVLHILKVAGPEHVGFGADWDGGGGVVGMEDVTALPRITARLLQEGYTEAQIGAMWSGNLLRVLGEAQRIGRELRVAGGTPDAH